MQKYLCAILLSFFLGFFSFSLSTAQSPAAGGSSFRGDIDGNGRIDIFDLLGLLKLLGGAEFSSDRQREIANVDKSADSAVNIFDLLGLLRLLAGAEPPEVIVWGPPELLASIPANASAGDTISLETENLPPGAEVTVLLDGAEFAYPERSGNSLRLALPDSFGGGFFSLAVGGDTTDPLFVNLPNLNPPVIAGCRILPADNPWNQPVSGFPVHPNSDNYVDNIGRFDYLHPDLGRTYGIPFVAVGGGQPRVPLTFTYADECDPGPYPIPPNAPIEGGASSTGDRHILVLDSTNCMLYETFSSYYQSPGWAVGSGAVFDLRSNALRPDTWTSSDAAGLPILPGLVRYEEVAAGEVNHAIRFTVQNSQRAYIYPATHYASSSFDLNRPPMGLRMRLKADYDISRFTGQSLVIVRALKKYGIIMADNGSDWFISGAPNTRWNDNDLEQLKSIPGNSFEAVDVSAMVVSGKNERRNIWPGVSLTAPSDSAKFSAGGAITIRAEAYDNDGSVALVEFFANGTKLGETGAEPYEFTWSGAAAGSYSVTARATDNGGAMNTSYAIAITVE